MSKENNQVHISKLRREPSFVFYTRTPHPNFFHQSGNLKMVEGVGK